MRRRVTWLLGFTVAIVVGSVVTLAALDSGDDTGCDGLTVIGTRPASAVASKRVETRHRLRDCQSLVGLSRAAIRAQFGEPAIRAYGGWSYLVEPGRGFHVDDTWLDLTFNARHVVETAAIDPG